MDVRVVLVGQGVSAECGRKEGHAVTKKKKSISGSGSEEYYRAILKMKFCYKVMLDKRRLSFF